MPHSDKTKQVLENLLHGLHLQEAKKYSINPGDSYLVAGNGQLLGRITDNQFDVTSLLNEYGPFGSQYSPTSIFNEYSIYGGQYGQYSPNNPYCQSPPKLVIGGKVIGRVSNNNYVSNRIPTESFLYTLRHDIYSLLRGQIVQNEEEGRAKTGESFIIAEDGTFLGNLKPNYYDGESIFNKYGSFGSRYSDKSIFNPYGTYGSPYSSFSPYNKYSNSPPRIYVNGTFVGYLTKNKYIQKRVDPENILDWASDNVSRY